MNGNRFFQIALRISQFLNFFFKKLRSFNKYYFFFLLFSVENWDIFEKVMDYVYSRSIKSESNLHPALMSEPAVSITG